MSNVVINAFKEKCPFCEKGNVFKQRRSFLQIPQMNTNCSCCGRDFNGEPGYFFGAMYISYAIAVAAGILTFLVSWHILDITSINLTIGMIMAVIVSISYKNFKWSRILWLKIFPPGVGTNFFGGGNRKVSSRPEGK